MPYSGFTLERLGAETPALLDLVTCFAVTAVQDKVTAAQDRISGSTLERLGAQNAAAYWWLGRDGNCSYPQTCWNLSRPFNKKRPVRIRLDAVAGDGGRCVRARVLLMRNL